MELQEFVEQSLTQIICGVKAAQKSAAEHGAIINPRELSTTLCEDYKTGVLAQSCDFDVALTATHGSESKAGLGVFLGGFGAGGQGKEGFESKSLSRIKFSVMLVLPVADDKSEE